MRLDKSWIDFYDRGAQVQALQDLIDDSAARKHRPIAFLVPGPKDENHELLHDRLSRHPLPRLLFRQKENPNEVLPFNLPAADRDNALTRRRRERDLKRKLDIDLSEAVPDRLPPGLTYLRARITAGNKLDSPQIRTLKELFNLLSDSTAFPDLPPGKALCIGVSIEWNALSEKGISQKSLAQAFPESDLPNLRFRVLDVLSSPKKDQAVDWVGVIHDFAPDALSAHARHTLVYWVEGLFPMTGRLSMRELDEKFASLCP